MTRFLIALALMFTACAPTERTTASRAVAHEPRIDGNIRAVSAADIRTVLALMPAHFSEQHFKPVAIARIHVIDRNTMRVHYWPDSWTFARRVKGHWRIDYGDTERVIVKPGDIVGHA